MEVPNLVGLTLDEGLSILKDDFSSLNVTINEEGIPHDFYKDDATTGVKRIVRQRIIEKNNLELMVFTLKEIPDAF